MTAEALFEAIGMMGEKRLAQTEQPVKHISGRRVLRTLLAAALILSTLAITAYAVGGWLIFENPQQMLSAIFGDGTGRNHGDYREIPDPEQPGSLLAVQPGYDRVEPDPTVVEEIAAHVSPVGKSISYHGSTLTVDAFLYDTATRCGVITYTLTNPGSYYLQYDGEITFDGSPRSNFHFYGREYILADKTTPEQLAAAYYFSLDTSLQDFCVNIRDGMTHEELKEQYRQAMEQVKAEYTLEEATEEVKSIIGEEAFQEAMNTWENPEELIWQCLRDQLVDNWNKDKQWESEEKIYFDTTQSTDLSSRIFGDGAVTVSSISLVIDNRKLTFLGEPGPDGLRDMDSLVIRFADGSEYTVRDGETDNTLFGLDTTADGTMGTPYVIRTHMLNRVIDTGAIACILINGHPLTSD